MYQEQDLLRLISCLEASCVLHVFALSLVWHQPHPGAADTPAPLIVILTGKPAIILRVNEHATVAPVARSSSFKKPATRVYFTASALTRRPEMIGSPPLAMEIAQGINGEVVFRLSISRTGEVTKVERLSSTLPHDLEGQLAFSLYRNQYRAGEIDGVAVNSEMMVDLKLDSSGWISDNIPVLGQPDRVGLPAR